MSGPEWVYVPRIGGWVREHDPATQSGLVPKKKDNCGDSCLCKQPDAMTTPLDLEDLG